MVVIIELCVWVGGMLEVLELGDMLAGVLQCCLRHWEWSEALPQEARVARWNLLGLWACQLSRYNCGYTYLQLNGSTAAQRFAGSPELETRGGSDGLSFPSVGVIAAGAGRAEGGGAGVGDAPSDSGTGVDVLVGAKRAARRVAASPELEARGGPGGPSSPSVGVIGVGASRAVQLSRWPVGDGVVLQRAGSNHGAPLESDSNVGDALISTDASDGGVL